MTCDAMEDLELNLPPGFSFLPTDVELVTYYLKPKIEGMPLPVEFMKEADDKEIYSCSPYDHLRQRKGSQLTDSTGNGHKHGGTWYFFTPQKDSIHGIDFNSTRVTAEGFWKYFNSGEPIHDSSGNILAYKRCSAYFRGTPPKGKKTRWIMEEYMLVHNNTEEKNYYVLGRIRYKPTA